MADHIYKSIDLTGSSTASVEDAAQKAVGQASKTLHNLRWFQVSEVRGMIDRGQGAHSQVTMKVGFTFDG
jgi:flavin-binding protein dodecin